ncbi:MAG: S8 family serine peptidase [Sedimentisphaerales bacterium]|nr:S8 family serine peptidase [Sedimentisphaerales bacterium]
MRFLFVSGFLIFINSTLANNANEILLKSRQFIPAPGVTASTKASIKEIKGKVHILIQLENTTTIEQRKQLETKGVRLLTYVPNKTWFASIDSNRIDEIISLPIVRAIIEILPQDKIAPAILENGVNDYSTNLNGEARMMILFFSDVSLIDASSIISGYGGTIRAEVQQMNALEVYFPKDLIFELANNDAVKYIEQFYEPTTANDGARAVSGADIVQGTPYNLTGQGVIVGEWDEGCVDDTHDDLEGRVIKRDCCDMSLHATHGAGTMLGNGIRSAECGGTSLQWKGMASEANLVSYKWWLTDTFKLYSDFNEAINEYHIDLSTNSWGNLSWDVYSTVCNAEDNVVIGACGKRIPMLWCVHNQGGSWHTIRVNAVAKNVISVGATNSNDDSIYNQSSRGPTADGRIKPDIVAPGCQVGGDGGIKSTWTYNCYYRQCGTSTATPVVTGCASLMLQHWRNTHTGQPDPLPSTIKAILLHTAVDLGNSGPDFTYGWGRVNIKDAVDFISEDLNNIILEDTIVDKGDKKQFSFIVFPNQPKLKITLVWDDYPGDPAAEKALVNDLDLIVRDPNGTRYYPWVLDVNSGHEDYPAVHGEDRLNNIEQVCVDNPVSGTWTVEVNGFDIPQPVQLYSLVGNVSQKLGLNLIKVDDINDGNCVLPFSPITYTIFYDANGVADSNVKIVDYLPDELTYISSSPEGEYYPFDGTVTWNIGTIASDDNGVFTLNAQVNILAESNSIITNFCEIEGDYDESSAEVNTPVCTWNPGDIYINKIDDVNDGNCVFPFSPITYTISYDANGVFDSSVKIVDYLPEDVDYISSSPEGEYYPFDDTVTWDIGNITPDDNGVFTINVMVNNQAESGIVLTNRCEIDGDLYYRSSEVNTPVCTWNQGSVCLDIFDNINDENCVSPETPITYTITYDANGAVDKNVSIVDYLPIELDYNSSSPEGVYNAGERTVTWNIGNLPPNGQRTFTINTQVNYQAEPCSVITNICEIRGDSIYKSSEVNIPVCIWIPGVIFVDCSRLNGADTGISWFDAYLDLRDALDRASIDSNITQIWVADGNYMPSVPANNPTFQLIDGITLYGHFDGNETSISQRNFNNTNKETTLKGTGISYQNVVTALDLSPNNIFDGFKIVGGYLGIKVVDSNLLVSNCHITGNRAGISANFSSFIVAESIIQDNNDFGIDVNYSSETKVINSILCDNGFGIHLREVNAPVTVQDCSIYNNMYGIYNQNASIHNSFSTVVIRCKIFENQEGIWLRGDSNSIIQNNWIYRNGYAGVYITNGALAIIRNTTIVSEQYCINRAGGINPLVSNCILLGGIKGVTKMSNYSWFDGDPCFIDADNNDFHLRSNSPCIDAGDPNFNDFNDTDIDGQRRILFGTSALRVDFGADEFYWPKADYNRDKTINLFDYSLFAPAWNEPNELISLDDDNDVDIYDLAIFCDDWLWQAP